MSRVILVSIEFVLQKFDCWGVQLHGENMGWGCSITCLRQGTMYYLVRNSDTLSSSRSLLMSMKLYFKVLTVRGGRGGKRHDNSMDVWVLHTISFGIIIGSTYHTFEWIINYKYFPRWVWCRTSKRWFLGSVISWGYIEVGELHIKLNRSNLSF